MRRRIVTFGDAVLDVLVAPTRPPVPDDDVPAAVTLGGGGQAANVARWCAHLGAEVSLVTTLGDDDGGRLVATGLAAAGVTVRAPVRAVRTGTVVVIVDADGRRTMLSDRLPLPLAAADVDPDWFTGAGWLHLSGYGVLGDDPPDPLEAATRLARAAGARVSLDLSAATLVTALGPAEARRRLRSLAPDLLFGTEAEYSALGPLEVPIRVTKRGARGCLLETNDEERAYPAIPVDVVRDTTGAGDAFAAGWLVGGADLALATAARCIGATGAGPP